MRITKALLATTLLAATIGVGASHAAPLPTNVATMKAMVDNLPADAVWAGFGIGRMQMPMAAQAVLLGGNVRVGLEDNLWLDKGVLATNGQLVERASEILSRLGARVMTPAEGRIKMGLAKRG